MWGGAATVEPRAAGSTRNRPTERLRRHTFRKAHRPERSQYLRTDDRSASVQARGNFLRRSPVDVHVRRRRGHRGHDYCDDGPDDRDDAGGHRGDGRDDRGRADGFLRGDDDRSCSRRAMHLTPVRGSAKMYDGFAMRHAASRLILGRERSIELKRCGTSEENCSPARSSVRPLSRSASRASGTRWSPAGTC